MTQRLQPLRAAQPSGIPMKFTKTLHQVPVHIAVSEIASMLADEQTYNLRRLAGHIQNALRERRDGLVVLPSVSNETPPVIDEHGRSRNAKIYLIKAVRRACALTLEEAKEAVELGLTVQAYDGEREYLIKAVQKVCNEFSASQ